MTSTFADSQNFFKIHKKTPVPDALFKISIFKLYWKERIRYRYFWMNFTRCIRRAFYRTPSGNCFCSAEKYFTTKIVKSLLKKENKLETVCKKNKGTCWKQTWTHLHHVVIFFYYSKISLLLSSLLSITH